MGYSSRGQFIEKLPGMSNPAPSKYDISKTLDFGGSEQLVNGKQKKGLSFRAGYNENLYYPKSHLVTMKSASQIPGPGKYNTCSLKAIGNTGKKATLKGRLPSNFIVIRDVPGPNSYDLNYASIESSRFKGVTFGAGDRPDSFFPPGEKILLYKIS